MILIVFQAWLSTYITSDNYGTPDDGRGVHRESFWQEIKNHTFKGVCGPGAGAAYYLAKKAGFTAELTISWKMNHAWCVIKDRDDEGEFWKGIWATSYYVNFTEDTRWLIDEHSNSRWRKWYNDLPYTSKCYNRIYWGYIPTWDRIPKS